MEDVILCMERIRECLSDLKSRRSLKEDHHAADAVIRNIEIMGEAAKNVSAEIKRKHPEFPWRRIADWKSRIVTKKSAVDPEALSNLVRDELPELLKTLKKIYVAEKNHQP